MKSIFALDLGTTKFCMAGYVFHKTSPKFEIVSIPSEGMKRGMLANLTQAENSISKLIQKAEATFGEKIHKVAVGVAGSHLSSRIQKVSINLKPHPIDYKVLNTLKDLADTQAQLPGREVLHLLPISYEVDERTGLQNPLNMSGSTITATYFILDSDQLYLRDIVNVCNSCGLEVSALHSEPYASSLVTVPESHKKMGLAVADIGGGTTDGIVFIQGHPISCFSLNIGGHMMTNDIAVGLNLPYTEAEKAKAFFGLSGVTSQQELSLSNINGETVSLKGSTIQKILAQRVFEWSDHLAEALKPFKGMLGAGILLTGGGSDITSLSELLKSQFQIPVATTKPKLPKVPHLKEESYASTFATVIGMVTIELEAMLDQLPGDPWYWKKRYFSSLINWVKELS